jgi:L,D-peptidoglycan transpeptidase YkuD (ErfK/YbiS/YcfS/YnhG family)
MDMELHMKRIFILAISFAIWTSSLANAGTPDFAKIHKLNAKIAQLLWVEATQSPQSVAQLWAFENGAWVTVGDQFPVVVGRNGTSKDKYEGDGKSPEGLYPLTQTFGVDERQNMKMEYIKIQADDKWIDDVNHPDYNTWIRGDTTATSYETMLRTDHQYDLLAVVGYNMMPIVPGRGSAIFVHIWLEPTKGTAGCVAMAPEQMEKFAQWLDPQLSPHILIGEENQ